MTDYSEILGNVSKDKFRQVANRLLNECFLLKKAETTASDYRFVLSNRDVFEGVLDLLGYELVIREDQGVITVNNPCGTGRVHFSKLESILLLILRLLYIEKMKELSQVQEVIILVEDIYEKYAMLKLPKFRKDQLLNALRSFKRVNLILNLDRLDPPDAGTRIQIYPSILLAVTAASLEEIYKAAQDKLAEYGNGGDSIYADGTADEAADENPAD